MRRKFATASPKNDSSTNQKHVYLSARQKTNRCHRMSLLAAKSSRTRSEIKDVGHLSTSAALKIHKKKRKREEKQGRRKKEEKRKRKKKKKKKTRNRNYFGGHLSDSFGIGRLSGSLFKARRRGGSLRWVTCGSFGCWVLHISGSNAGSDHRTRSHCKNGHLCRCRKGASSCSFCYQLHHSRP